MRRRFDGFAVAAALSASAACVPTEHVEEPIDESGPGATIEQPVVVTDTTVIGTVDAVGRQVREPGVAADSLARRMLVDVQAVDSTIVVDARYASSNNFTGAPLPGYHAGRALLRTEAAEALSRAQQRLKRSGYGLKVWDGYRPARATRAMVEWAESTGREELLNGWIARRSRHNMGLAVDVTLVELATGDELDMGTDFDTFTRESHTAQASGSAARHRQILVNALEREGFSNYFREWWHFDYRAPNPLRFDIPIREPADR